MTSHKKEYFPEPIENNFEQNIKSELFLLLQSDFAKSSLKTPIEKYISITKAVSCAGLTNHFK